MYYRLSHCHQLSLWVSHSCIRPLLRAVYSPPRGLTDILSTWVKWTRSQYYASCWQSRTGCHSLGDGRTHARPAFPLTCMPPPARRGHPPGVVRASSCPTRRRLLHSADKCPSPTAANRLTLATANNCRGRLAPSRSTPLAPAKDDRTLPSNCSSLVCLLHSGPYIRRCLDCRRDSRRI